MLAAGVPREWRPGQKARDFHSFRHTFARIAIEHGVGLEWIAEQLGQSSISVTERSYKHFLTEARHRAAAALEGAFAM